MSRMAPSGAKALKYLAGIEDALGIEHALEAAHEVERDRILHRRQQIALEHADAVFGGDRAAELLHDREYRSVDLVPALEIVRLVGADRLGDVVMDIAVAEMAERHRPRPGNNRGDRRRRLLKERRHRRDRDGDIVLDRAAGMALRLA